MHKNISIYCLEPEDKKTCLSLCEETDIELVFHHEKIPGLVFEHGRLGFYAPSLFEEIYIVSLKQQKGHSRGDYSPLLKAICGQQNKPLSILDTTAGFLGDAQVLVNEGHQVVCYEHNSLVYLLSRDALRRQPLYDKYLQLKYGSSLSVLNQEAEFDVIYFDPMFEKSKKGAKPQKAAQILRIMNTHKNDMDELESFNLLRRLYPTTKIVVKRGPKSPTLKKTGSIVKSSRVRFDIY